MNKYTIVIFVLFLVLSLMNAQSLERKNNSATSLKNPLIQNSEASVGGSSDSKPVDDSSGSKSNSSDNTNSGSKSNSNDSSGSKSNSSDNTDSGSKSSESSDSKSSSSDNTDSGSKSSDNSDSKSSSSSDNTDSGSKSSSSSDNTDSGSKSSSSSDNTDSGSKSSSSSDNTDSGSKSSESSDSKSSSSSDNSNSGSKSSDSSDSKSSSDSGSESSNSGSESTSSESSDSTSSSSTSSSGSNDSSSSDEPPIKVNYCIAYISTAPAGSGSSSSDSIECGKTELNPCSSLDEGIASCISQGLSNNMTLNFKSGVYMINNVESYPIFIYNQTLTLNGDPSGNTLIQLNNVNSNIFSIFEPIQTALPSDFTSLTINNIIFINYLGYGKTSTGSFLKATSRITNVNLSIFNSVFNHFSSESGTVFNLNVDMWANNNQKFIPMQLTVENTQFSEISAGSGAVLYANNLISSSFQNSSFSSCNVNNSVIYSSSGSSTFLNCTFRDNTIQTMGVISLLNQEVQLGFNNCTFTGNQLPTGINPTNNAVIYLSSSAGMVTKSSFLVNSLPALFIQNNLNTTEIVSETLFYQSLAPVIIASQSSNLYIESSLFLHNYIINNANNSNGIVIAKDSSITSLIRVNFTGNSGINIFTSNSNIEISDITSNDNKGLVSCSSSNITFTDTNSFDESTDLGSDDDVLCQSTCNIQSSLKSKEFACPIDPSSSSSSPSDKNDDKPFIKTTFGILVVVIGVSVILAALIVFSIKFYLHSNRNGYIKISGSNDI